MIPEAVAQILEILERELDLQDLQADFIAWEIYNKLKLCKCAQ